MKYFDIKKDGVIDEKDCPPFRWKLVGCSWGAWTALQMASDLSKNRKIKNKADLHLEIGTVDPVDTIRDKYKGWIPFFGGTFKGSRPAGITIDNSINYYQQNGIENILANGAFKGSSVSWMSINKDVSSEPMNGGVRVEVVPAQGGRRAKNGRPAVPAVPAVIEYRIGHMGIIERYGPMVVQSILNSK